MVPVLEREACLRLLTACPPGRRAFFFDLDGTLLDLAPTPDRVTVPAQLREDLRRLSRVHLVALVSGRALSDMLRLMAIGEAADFYLAGNHGQELRGPGWRWEDPRGLAARERLNALRRSLEALCGQTAGAFLEWKEWSISIHDRLAAPGAHPQLGRQLAALLAPHPELVLREAKGAWEIRPRGGPTKGDAVHAILRHAGLDAEGPPCRRVVFGDDRTDADAFQALAGQAILVAVGPLPVAGATVAVDSPATVRWLVHRLVSIYCQ